MEPLDTEIYSALSVFATEILESSWDGRREREAVSTFAFGPLLERINPDGFLTDPTQIGLEVPVPQVVLPAEDGTGKKRQVCKDLVIWENPRMTCWDSEDDPTIPPSAILEWKFSTNGISERDVRWLTAFTSEYPDCTGYAVTANRPGSPFILSCTRVSGGDAEPEWLHLE